MFLTFPLPCSNYGNENVKKIYISILEAAMSVTNFSYRHAGTFLMGRDQKKIMGRDKKKQEDI